MKSDSPFQFLANPLMPDPKELLNALTRAGHSNTRARRAVLEALRQAGGQANSADLLALGRTYHPGLGLVTVYRTLDILERLGLVRKLHLNEGCHSYAVSALAIRQADADSNIAHDAASFHSHHIICQRCSRAVEFRGCDLGVVVAAVETQTGFLVQEHWLEMFGVCPECREADKQIDD